MVQGGLAVAVEGAEGLDVEEQNSWCSHSHRQWGQHCVNVGSSAQGASLIAFVATSVCTIVSNKGNGNFSYIVTYKIK